MQFNIWCKIFKIAEAGSTRRWLTLSDSYPKELSGGEMRRVSIARALMNGPKLLILDEPTGDLDATSTTMVMRLLRNVADETAAVLIVTHDGDTLPYADRVYAMDAGRLTPAGGA